MSEPFERLLGTSEPARATREFGRRAAAVDAPVLLTGESGTGKGLLARAIHQASDRARGPFIAVNCAALPESLFESELFGHARGAFTGAQQAHRGLLEQADGGTLFLDEIGELALPLQAKLLTTLEDGELRRVGGERTRRIRFRLITATNADLERAVDERRFRRDLLHRLLVLAWRMPALRERPDDIELLARRFVDDAARRYGRAILGLHASARSRILEHAWPGNVRELAHALEAAVLACDGGLLHARHLPLRILRPGAATTEPPRDAQEPGRRYAFYGPPAEERRRIEEALRRCHGNKTRAAASLGMARNTLRAKLRSLAVPVPDQPPSGH